MAGSINIALQGLSVAMQGFETSSNNIANVNTPGYSRQQINLAARAAPEQGVRVTNVDRVVDQFATQQHWSSTAAFVSTESFAIFAGQIDDLLANPNTSISAATDNYFSALQTGVDDPASIPNRELILAQTEALALRFFEVDRQLRLQNEAINSTLQSSVASVNEMAGQVASLNDLIRLADARGEPANELQDQRDTLILQISEQVGGIVQTGTGGTDINLYIGNGQPLVIGGNASQLISRQGDPDINDIEVFVQVNGQQINVSDQVREGKVGGLLKYKDEVLLPTWNELGRLAIVLADTVNEQHNKGLDLDGNMAGNLFADPAFVGDVKAFSSNATSLDTGSNMVIRDTSLLQATDYVVKFGENQTFSLTRTSDGKIFTQADFQPRTATLVTTYEDGTFAQSTGFFKLNIDGVDITLESTNGLEFGVNDKVLIQPVRAGAELMKVEITSGRELAFASPVRVEAAVDNTGVVEIEDVSINERLQLIPVAIPDLPGPPVVVVPDALVYFTDENTYSVYEDPSPAAFDLATATPYAFADASSAIGRSFDPGKGIDINGVTVPATQITDSNGDPVEQLKTRPMQLLFGTTTTVAPPVETYDSYDVYDMTDPANPEVVSLNNRYVEGQPIQLQGFEVTPRGKPQPGDKINLSFNTDAVSDNRNALKLSNMQQQQLVDGATYQDNYGRLVERIGTQASVANINLEANQTIMLNAESVRNGVSGVNLDEEAANLIQFQQQYQAASQVINTARSLFESLLSSVG